MDRCRCFPLRFLPDWALHVRASKHFNLRTAPDCLLQPSDIQSAVRYVESWYRLTPIVQPPRSSSFAQTDKDRTLINNGRFCDPNDAWIKESDAQRAAFTHQTSSLAARKTQSFEPLVEVGGHITKLETYARWQIPLSAITLSSSVGREARAFGRKVTILSPAVQDWAYSGVDVMRYARSPQFWGPLLSSSGLSVTPVTEPDWLPNGLRKTIGGQGLDMAVWAGGHQ
jgi:hypothetical protein